MKTRLHSFAGFLGMATIIAFFLSSVVAGAVNITLMGLNVRDGLLLTGRLGKKKQAGHEQPAVTIY